MPGLEAAKAYAALVATLCGVLITALTAVLAPNTTTSHVVIGILVVVSAVASALATYQTSNVPSEPRPTHRSNK